MVTWSHCSWSNLAAFCKAQNLFILNLVTLIVYEFSDWWASARRHCAVWIIKLNVVKLIDYIQLIFLQNSKRKSVRSVLYVSGDGLRVVDDDTRGLILDQTIEKVSFCAPDRNYDRGFSYICRDGTTRRWMCHGFMALKDSVRSPINIFVSFCTI